jgi:hypothetical protein
VAVIRDKGAVVGKVNLERLHRFQEFPVFRAGVFDERGVASSFCVIFAG